MTLEEYQDWLVDVSRESFRILLVEIDHSAGTVFLASRPFLSRENIAYDDFLTRMPYLEDDIEDFKGVGDFEAVNEESALDWTNFEWYGHECRWYYGDISWDKSQFRAIATANVEEVRPLGASVYRFELMNNGTKLNQKLVLNDTTRNETVSEAVEWISDVIGIAITLDNIPENKLSWNIEYEMTARTTAEDVLRLIAVSINAHLKTDQLGNTSIFIVAGNAVQLTEDIIASNRINVERVVPAYRNVDVVLYNDTRVTDITNAATGIVNDTIEYVTALTNTADATTLLAEYVNLRAVTRKVWGVPIVNSPEIIDIGTRCSIVHPDLNNVGHTVRIKRRPDSTSTIIEVEV